VEAALDAAAVTAPDAVKRKTYRESLQNNRENILLSKELVTIHTSVPIEFSLDEMRTQPVDNAACRELFSELEFTTLLKELAPAADNAAFEYTLRPTAAEVAPPSSRTARTPNLQPVSDGAAHGLAIAIFEDARAIAEEVAVAESESEAADNEAEPAPAETMDLFAGPQPTLGPLTPLADASTVDPACRLGLAVEGNAAMEAALDAPGLRAALEDATLPKLVHDLKAVLRALAPHGITLRGAITDVMLQSYLVNPTHASHTLPDIAARSTNRALVHQPTKPNPADPKRLAEAAAAIVRLTRVFAEQMAESDAGAAASPGVLVSDAAPSTMPATPLRYIYESDGSAARSRAAAHGAGRRAHRRRACCRRCRRGWRWRWTRSAERILRASGRGDGQRVSASLQHQLAEAAGRCALQQDGRCRRPMKYGKGKVTLHRAVDVLEELAEEHRSRPRPGARVSPARQAAVHLHSTQLPQLVDARRPRAYDLQPGRARRPGGSRRPIRICRTFPSAPRWAARFARRSSPRRAIVLMSADYSQIELRLMAHFSQDPLLLNAYRDRPGHPHAHRGGGLRRRCSQRWTKRRATAPRR
jgi:DNA polymerase-1